ncbi:MAG: outer membrane beta-barrel protein [Chitinophagaceae bacterium]|nr:outer membrane beta-barrel protein [Chitinophagaceae bacterium]
MQYIDNDMDELFKKAGSDYPLKTDNADFDKVLAGLRPAPASPKPNYKQYSWLLLLLLLPFGYVLVNKNIADSSGVNISDINPPAVKPQSEIANPPFFKGGEQSHDNTNTLENLKNSKPGNSGPYTNSNKSANTILKSIAQHLSARSAVSPAGRLQSPKAKQYEYNDRYSIESQKISYPKPVINFPALPVSPVVSNPKKNQKQQTNSFYLGILAGPDFSTVKYQEINNMGYSVGILAGYRFAKRWSVETGFIYDSKKYYTDGQHFDKTNAGIPPSVYVESLDGSCDMFEVPLLLRYDFSENKNRFFASMGATSYFMKKEKYAYGAYASGVYYEGHRTYDNSGNWLFANAQFSIGYNKQLAPKTNLRIEPYIKIPIKDIGIGNLPITSTGIYFSVTQRIK